MSPSKAKSSRIVSLSLNPAIDLTYETPSLIHEEISRASKNYFDPGGTGINVGRALEKLQANSHTCYFSAGKTGELFDSLVKQQLKHVTSLRVEGETRINTTIVQQSPQQQYQINASNFSITAEQLDKITRQFLTLCGQGIGILTGSLPLGIPDSTYRDIDLALQKQGGRSIIDAPAHILRKSLSSKPFMIKPNLHELESLCNKHLNSIAHIAAESRQIVQQGISYVCVSLGKQGALISSTTNSYYCNSPAINIQSTVGSGDSVVAGLAFAFALEKSPANALKLAVACGAGTAKQPGTQLFSPEELNHLSSKINVTALDI